MGVSLHSKTHPLFIKYSNMMAQAHSVMHITIRACFLYFFYNPYMSLFNFIAYGYSDSVIGAKHVCRNEFYAHQEHYMYMTILHYCHDFFS